jgi:hypothetical protein
MRSDSRITPSKFIAIFSLRSFRPILGVGAVGIAFLVFNCQRPSVSQDNTELSVQIENKQIQTQERFYEQQLPFAVSDCSDANPWVHQKIRFYVLENPYFVRGDFDGDGKNDYAITVESRTIKRDGLLVCFGDKKKQPVLLGLDPETPPPFWRLLDWDVQTLEQIKEKKDSKGNRLKIKPAGESIVMYWEDAVGIIYWDGKQFQWKLHIFNDGE